MVVGGGGGGFYIQVPCKQRGPIDLPTKVGKRKIEGTSARRVISRKRRCQKLFGISLKTIGILIHLMHFYLNLYSRTL